MADGLRLLGIGVTTMADASLRGAADADQIAYWLAQGRLIFSQDDDFLVLAAAGNPHAGVVYCHQNTTIRRSDHPGSGADLGSLRTG